MKTNNTKRKFHLGGGGGGGGGGGAGGFENYCTLDYPVSFISVLLRDTCFFPANNFNITKSFSSSGFSIIASRLCKSCSVLSWIGVSATSSIPWI